MRRGLAVGLAVAGLAAVGVALGRSAGSEPEERGFEGPLPLCGDTPNCYRTRASFAAGPEALREAALAAVRASDHLLTGRALRVVPSESGGTAVFRSGPFRDDLALAVVPGPGGGATLHLRSASRVGENDLGVNRARVRRILADVRRRLGA